MCCQWFAQSFRGIETNCSEVIWVAVNVIQWIPDIMTAFATKKYVTTMSCHFSDVSLQSECSAWAPLSLLLHQERHYLECHHNKKTMHLGRMHLWTVCWSLELPWLSLTVEGFWMSSWLKLTDCCLAMVAGCLYIRDSCMYHMPMKFDKVPSWAFLIDILTWAFSLSLIFDMLLYLQAICISGTAACIIRLGNFWQGSRGQFRDSQWWA